MSQFTEAQREEIIAILGKHSPQNIAIFDGINEKKLNNAISTYGETIPSDEEIFLQYDGTAWGSAKDGFLMTNLGIYSKNLWESTKSATYQNIHTLNLKKTNLEVSVKVSENFNITLVHTPKNIYAFLQELLPLAQTGFKTISQQSKTNPSAQIDNRCNGCGAPTHSHQAFCEYCGNPLN